MGTRNNEQSAAFARTIDEQLLNRPIEIVGVVDVRRYAGLTRPLALTYLRRSARDGREHRRARRVERGIDASPLVVNRWHLVGDFEGALFSQFGVERDPPAPIAWLVDRLGVRHGPYREVGPLLDEVMRAARAM